MKLGYLHCYVGSNIEPFDQLFSEAVEIVDASDVAGCDAIILWGGEDIASYYYGERPHPRNQNRSGKPTVRDRREWAAMQEAKALGIPIIGICRGAQFLCAFAGGKLIQHIEESKVDHHGNHELLTYEGEVYQTSSCHHQAMDVTSLETDKAVVLATCGSIAECVWFPEVKGFAIQGHPEWMREDAPYTQWVFGEFTRLALQNNVEA